MNVVQVTWSFNASAGGSALAIRDLQKALGGGIISFGDSEGAPELTDFVAVPPRKRWLSRGYGLPDPAALASARTRIASANLVICHLLYRYHVQWVAHTCRQLGIPYWMVLHGALDPTGLAQRALAKRTWLRLVGKPALRDASLVVTATRSELAKAKPWLDDRPAAVLPWPVDLPPPIDREATRQRWRTRLGIPAHAFVLLYLGRLDPIKQPGATIRAAALAGRAGAVSEPPLHLLMVGPDSRRLTAADCLRDAGAVDLLAVHLPGPVYGDARWEVFCAADAFITLSLQENFGYALVEALAAGLPAIVSPRIDLAAEPIPGAWVATDTSPESAAVLIQRLRQLPAAEREALGASGREWARNAFTRAGFAARVRQLADRAASAGEARTPLEVP